MSLIDLSDLDPLHSPSSASIFSKPSAAPTPPSTATPPPPSRLPATATQADPLDAFDLLSFGDADSGPSAIAADASVVDDARKRADERKGRVLEDLARDPWTTTGASSQVPPRPGVNGHPARPTRRQSRSSYEGRDFASSPPRRLSGLMAREGSFSASTHHTNAYLPSLNEPKVSSPDVEEFHPSSPGGSSSWGDELRRRASEDWSDFHSAVEGSSFSSLDPNVSRLGGEGWPGAQQMLAAPESRVLSSSVPSLPPKERRSPARTSSARNTQKGFATAPSSRERRYQSASTPGSANNSDWNFDPHGYSDSPTPPASIKLDGIRDGVVKVMTEDVADGIRPGLPPRARLSNTWKLVYSLDQHGISLLTLFDRVRTVAPPSSGTGLVLVVRDSRGSIFGAYLNEGIRKRDGYYGDGSCFLWKSTPFDPGDVRLMPQVKRFGWTGKNDYFLFTPGDSLSVGGGDGKFGLYVDGKLEMGYTSWCPCFGNEPLTRDWKEGGTEKFAVVGFELWAVDA